MTIRAFPNASERRAFSGAGVQGGLAPGCPELTGPRLVEVLTPLGASGSEFGASFDLPWGSAAPSPQKGKRRQRFYGSVLDTRPTAHLILSCRTVETQKVRSPAQPHPPYGGEGRCVTQSMGVRGPGGAGRGSGVRRGQPPPPAPQSAHSEKAPASQRLGALGGKKEQKIPDTPPPPPHTPQRSTEPF